MKAKGLKFISLIILLAMIFTTFGCDSTPETTTPSDSAGLQGENIGGYLSINNIEKLNDYLKMQDVPDNFVTPDMLIELGTFRFFYHKKGEPLHEGYLYSFLHENRYNLSVNINTNSSSALGLPDISESLLGSTMATITENTKGVITSNELRYCYMKGRLWFIEWTVDNIGYSFKLTDCSSEQLEEMPSTLSEDSILRKLLSKDAEDQIAAYNQLVDMVTK